MKSDIDRLMQANEIEVLLVTGPAQHNPAMTYLTGGGHITGGDLIKPRGRPAVLFHGPMERDEATRTGLEAISYARYPYGEIYREAKGDPVVAAAIRYTRMLADLGIDSGRVALYGKVDLATAYPVMSELQRRMPGLTLTGDPGGKILGAAMMTKDADEVARIRRMGQVTTEVVGLTAEYLTTRPRNGEMLLDEDGQPLTIGKVKRRIDLWVAERGAAMPEGFIFAAGHDAGVPHSSGNPDEVLRLGVPIVFDIFPSEAGGGYHYDFTRTWCLGYASEEVQRVYDHVQHVFDTLLRELEPGRRYSAYQERACTLYQDLGHPTIATDPATEEGYVHSLGHGVGLKIHERPMSGSTAPVDDILAPGVVVTLEPGLYYPSRGLGVRLEDTLAMREDGTFEILAPYPYDLVLPVRD